MELFNSMDRKTFNKLFYSFVVAGLFVFGFLLFQSFRFHLVKTTPSLSAITIITPSISFNYNKPLSSAGLVISSESKVINSYTINGKSLVIRLDSSLLAVGKSYVIEVGPLQSLSGNKLPKRVYAFKVVSISFDQLSKTQRDAILKNQANPPYSRGVINYLGFDNIVTNGLSAVQEEVLKQAFFLYSKSISEQVSQITVVSGTLVLGPYDSNSPNPVSSVTFGVKIDSTILAAKLVYSGLSDVQLYLYGQPGGSVIYDSGLLTPDNL